VTKEVYGSAPSLSIKAPLASNSAASRAWFEKPNSAEEARLASDRSTVAFEVLSHTAAYASYLFSKASLTAGDGKKKMFGILKEGPGKAEKALDVAKKQKVKEAKAAKQQAGTTKGSGPSFCIYHFHGLAEEPICSGEMFS
jgi:hypothetical protein